MKYFPPLKYAMPALLGALGVILVSLAFFDGIQRSELLIENESRSQVLTLGTRVSARLEQLYAARDTRGVDDSLMRIANEPHLVAAVVVDALGNTVDSVDAGFLNRKLIDFATPGGAALLEKSLSTGNASHGMDEQRSNLEAVFPIALPPDRGELRSKRYAALYLRTDLSEIKRLNWVRHMERALIMAIVVALALALVWLYFHWVITKRLAKLLNAMQRVAYDDASDRDIDVSGRDEVGRLGAGFAAMLAEIRARSNALAVSEERHRSVVQSMSEGIVIIDSKGKIISANESAARMIGVSREDFESRDLGDVRWRVFREDGSALGAEEFPSAIALRTGRTIYGVVLGVLRPDGEIRWLSANSAPLWLDAAQRERGAVATISDITERRAAESEARRTRERLAAIVNSAMDGIVSVDGNMRVTVFNGSAEKMFGRKAEDMIGRSLDVLLPIRFRGKHSELMKGFAQTGVISRAMGVPGKIIGLRADGTEFPLEASVARVNLGDETILTVMLRDISERARAEEQRAQLEAQLRQSQKMQSLGTFTGGIAHDFNNILTAISGNVRLAITDVPRAHEAQRSLAEIDKAASRATDLVRQVLAFGRRQEAQRAIVDIAAVMQDALSFLRAMIPATIEIRSRFADSLPRVAVDKTQVHQVMTNLGSNAAHAIGERPGVIDVELTAVQISGGDLQQSVDLGPGEYVRLAFSDNGAGIDAALLDRIFEPFFTTKGLGQGTGLGLSVVHGIMKNHDGAITVHSTRGVGTRFELYFPACAQTAITSQSEVRATVAESKIGNGKVVIYVDDEEALVFLVTRILERHGYEVLGFNQPKHALAELAKNPGRIDALISDLAMPGMTGFDVAREALALRDDLPVVLVSGYIRPQDTAAAQTIGVRRIILKPDTVDALASSLHELLSNGQDADT